MHSNFSPVLRKLVQIRNERAIHSETVDTALGQAKGWLQAFENGHRELALPALASILHFYGTDFAKFFADIPLDLAGITPVESMTIADDKDGILLSFLHGAHEATVRIPGANSEQADELQKGFRTDLKLFSKSEAVATLMLNAVKMWPKANPSDLWLFFVHHSYLNRSLHPGAANADLEQSWKRTGGWALENVFVKHYNPFLERFGVSLEMPKKSETLRLLLGAGVKSHSAAEKADVLMLGQRQGRKVPFGVAHVKASFAERRTDDEPLSRELMDLGLASVLLTMDAKAMPSANPVNKGELGDSDSNGSKRLDIEREGMFQACFSYNSRTVPTREGASVAARIETLDLSDPDDRFSSFVVAAFENFLSAESRR